MHKFWGHLRNLRLEHLWKKRTANRGADEGARASLKPPRLLALEDRLLFDASPIAGDDQQAEPISIERLVELFDDPSDIAITDLFSLTALPDAPDVNLSELQNLVHELTQFSASVSGLDSESSSTLSVFNSEILRLATASPDYSSQFLSTEHPITLPERLATNLIVLDSRITGIDSLLVDLRAQQDRGRNLDILILDPTRSGIDQITEALNRFDRLDALQIVSHGDATGIQLGGVWFDESQLAANAASFEQWQDVLSDDADIVLYGCNLASSQAGRDLLLGLAVATGADVAASDDLTGHASLGGDWDLEFRSGLIDSEVAFGFDVQAKWFGTLATVTVSNVSIVANGNTSSIAALIAADGGDGISLMEAILAANNTGAADTINFNIAGAGPHTIIVTAALPTITNQVTIDGSSEPDWTTNGNRPIVILDGNNLAADGLVLTASADGSIIRGLVIRDFGGDGIEIQANSNGNTIAGNYIGRLNTSGTDAGAGEANTGAGINVLGANNTIGGLTTADRNVLSGNTSHGILITGAGATGNTVAGNYVGLTASGTIALGNGIDGIAIVSASANTIGGVTAMHQNVVAANMDDGVQIQDGDNNIVEGNRIGTDNSGNVDLGNLDDGIAIDTDSDNNQIIGNQISGNSSSGIDVGAVGLDSSGNIFRGNLIGTAADGVTNLGNTLHGLWLGSGLTATGTIIGGTLLGQGNTIAWNGGDGVYLQSSTGVSILGNSIFSNTQQGIDVGTNGVTNNDVNDGDGGANNQQNFPVLQSAVVSNSQIMLSGTLNSESNKTYRIEFFANATSDNEGQRFLGFTTVTTPAATPYTTSFNVTLNATVAEGEYITATATDPSGNTSEFSATYRARGTSGLWLSSTTSGTAGGVTWDLNTTAQFGGPGLSFEPGTTSGTFYATEFDLDRFGSGVGNLNGLHYVSRTVTVGSANAVTLLPGDVLFSTAQNETLGGVGINARDIALFRPTTSGNYSNGTFSVLLQNPLGSATRDFAFVEFSTVVGGVTLNAGDFLLTAANPGLSKDITRYQVVDVGPGTTSGTSSELIDGGSAGIGFANDIYGVELVQISTTLGGTALSAGQLLISLSAADVVGTNNLSVTQYDIFTLTVTATGTGTSSGTTTLLVQGSDIGLTVAGEELDAIALLPLNNAPVLDSSKSPTLTSINEDAGAPVGAVGTLVSALVDFSSPAGQVDNVTDLDGLVLMGIAITAADTSNGTWHYSIDGGSNWNSLGAVTGSAARLLAADANSRLYFQPTANYSGTITNAITFRAWDRTSGTNGSTASTSANGESNAYSTATDSASLTINAFNDQAAFTALNGTPAFIEGGSAVVLDANVTIFDAELSALNNFSGATLTLVRNGGADVQDVYSATGTLSALTQGGNLIVGGTTIGTVTNNSLGTLVLTFNANATNALVNSVMQQIAYGNSSDTPLATAQIYWVFDDGNTGGQGTGGALQVSGNVIVNITATNDAPFGNNDDGHLDFDGVDDFVSIANSASLTMSTTMTLEAWFKADAFPNLTQMIFNKEGEYEVAVRSDGSLQWAIAQADNSWTWHNTGYIVTTGVWTHVAVCYNSGVVTTYVNGHSVHSEAITGPIGDVYPAMNELRIGGRSNAANAHFDGAIDDVRVWNVARTQAQVQASMAATLVGNETGLVGYYKFDEQGGTVVTDGSTSGNNGTFGGGNATYYPMRVQYSTGENTPLVINAATGVLTNDRDVDGDTLTVTHLNGNAAAIGVPTTITSGATVTLNADGSFTYNPGTAFDSLAAGSTASDSFTYTISDGNGGTETAAARILIFGENDPPVITSNGGGNTASINVAENTTAVTTVTATDGDLPGQSLTYSITGGTDAGLFAIDSNTGVLTFVSGRDREAHTDADLNGIYEVTVRVFDGTLFDLQAISVMITDMDEFNVTSPVDLNAAANAVNENAVNGTTVGITANASDADATTNTVTYSLTDNAGGRFTIDANTGVVTVADGTMLDREIAASYSIVVQAASADGSIAAQTFNIDINSLNDNTPAITSDGGGATAAVNVAENSTLVTSVTASDADLPSETLTYTIIGGADAARFVIDSATGVLTFLLPPDFETPTDAGPNNVYNVTVRVSDGTYADSQSIAVTVTDMSEVPASYADMAIWRSSGDNSPNSAEWNGSSFGAAENTAGVGQWRIIDGAESPTRDEKIVLGVNGSGVISGEIYSSGVWTALPFSLSTVASSTNHGFDVAYESQSGHAIVVWNNNTSGTTPISFRVWDGSSWSAVQNITVPNAGQAVELQLAADPTSDEMILIVCPQDAFIDYAMVWNGSNWGNAVTLDSSVGLDRTEINVAYESQSGQALVVYDADASTNALAFRTWNGSSWSGQGVLPAPAGVGAASDASWTVLASDPTSDRIAIAVVADGNETWLNVWDGSSWGTGLTATNNASTIAARSVSVAFEATSGEALAVYAESGQNTVSFRTWTSGGGWSAEQTGPNLGAVPNSMTLSVDPDNNRLMLAVQDANNDLKCIQWDGSAWGTVHTLDTNTGETANQPFLFLYDASNNLPPTITSNGGGATASINVAENSMGVTTVAASDTNLPVQTLSYSITGGADAAFFAINSSSGALTLVSGRNRELPTDSNGDHVYEVTVQVSDGDGGFDTQAISVTITDVDEFDVTNPVDSNAVPNAVNENAVNGTVVGITASANDADATTNAVAYSLTDSAGGRFAIDANTGVVTVAGGINRETAASYNITVRTTSADGSTGDTVFTINLNDVDEFDVAAISDTNGAANSVAENATIGTVVGITAFAEDLDATSNTITYTLDDSAGGLFAIDGMTGVVTVNGTLNYEIATNHNITVRAGSSDGSSNTQLFTINVTDVNESGITAISDTDMASDFVTENVSVGTVVGVTAFADDLDGTDTVSYSLDDDAGGLFAIDSTTGVVTVVGAIDRETTASYNITVRATSTDTSSTTRIVAIAIGDVDEFNVSIPADVNAAVNAVNENVAISTTVGLTANAFDLDSTNNTITYSLTSNSGGLFQIDINTGVVTTAAVLDRETHGAVRSITVQAASSDGSAATQSFNITINDVDEIDVSIPTDVNAAANAVNENVAFSTTVGLTANAFDLDSTNNTITYSLTSNPGGLFQIDVNTGVVTTAAAIDRETHGAVRSITVQAASSDGSVASQSFNITINDLDEFDAGSVTDSNAFTNSVAENASVGTVVGLTALAQDLDATNNAITYSLDDNAGGRFTIDSVTGVATVAGALDYEAATSHNITVRASSSDGSSSTQVFLINVSDVSESGVTAISDNDAAADFVLENVSVGAVVGVTAFADDLDGTDTVSYSLDDNAGGAFAVDSTTGVVTVAGSIDRETAASYNITVRATSTDTSSTTRVFTIAIGDIDEFDVNNPVDVNAAANAVNENSANGTTVGITASASDADATTNTVTYTLFDNAGGRFAIDANTGVVTVANGLLLDREAATSHNISIRATSSDGSTADSVFTINLNDVDEFDVNNPADVNAAANAVNENSANGTTVGITASASDADATTNTVTYTLFDNAGGRFAIDANTGVVTVANGLLLDREAAASHNITVRATSTDTSTADTVFTINISDVDEFDVTAAVDTNIAANAINENAANGTLVGVTANASDADATTNTVTYSLTNNAGGRFAIDANTGVVTVADGTLLDREAAASHNITVRATSADASTADTVFTINISDVDEFDVTNPVDSNAATNGLNENVANGTVVGLTANSNDADATTNAVTYSLTDNAGGRFAIDANTGVVTVADGTLLDREAAASHNITVRATSADTSTADTVFTINISDMDEFDVGAPVDTNAVANAVNEIAANGTVVGVTANASDADATTNAVTYSLTDNAGGRFAVDANTGDVTVADGTLLDREMAASHSITVRATSADGSTADSIFTINVNDVDEFGVGAVTDVNAAVNTLAEDAAVGTAAGVTAFASDADATNNAMTYTLDDDAGGLFAIDGVMGVITLNMALDYELASSHILTVRATSADGSFRSQSFDISVTPVNDITPSIISNGGGSNAAVSVAENQTTVTTVTATDADFPSQTLTYSIVSGADAGLFMINSTTGELTFSSPPDFETFADSNSDGVYEVVVQVSDGGLVDQQTILVTVTNANEAPTDIAPITFGVDENTNTLGGYLLGVMSATDPDAGDVKTFSILAGADSPMFSFGGAGGNELILNDGAIDFERQSSYLVTVRVTDGNGQSYDEMITVNVNNLNDSPTAITPIAISLDENIDTSGGWNLGGLIATDQDAGDSFTFTIVGGVDATKFSIGGMGGNSLVLDDGMLDFERQSFYEVVIRVTDVGSLTHDETIRVSVRDLNEAPTNIQPNVFTVAENTDTSAGLSLGQFVATDEDSGESFTYSIIGGPDSAQFTMGGLAGDELIFTAGVINFEVKSSYSVLVRVIDGGGLSYDTTVVVAVSDVNENPMATSDLFGIAEEQLLSGNVLANDGDPDNDSLTAQLVSGPSNAGSFSLNADGTFTYTPSANYFGTDSFTYRANDGSLNSALVTVTINVSNVNDSPIGVADRYILPADLQANIVNSVTANDIDVDSPTLVAILVRQPLFGDFQFNSNGTFTYKPFGGFIGTDSFAYRPTDGIATGAEILVQLEVVSAGTQNSQPGVVTPATVDTTKDLPKVSETTTKSITKLSDSEPAAGQLVNILTSSNPIKNEISSGTLETDISNQLSAGLRLGDEARAASILDFILSVSQTLNRTVGTEQADALLRNGLSLIFNMQRMSEQLDSLGESLADERRGFTTAEMGFAISTVSMTAGYLIWSLRGGMLLATFVTSLPSWQWIDPLPILESYPQSARKQSKEELDRFFHVGHRQN